MYQGKNNFLRVILIDVFVYSLVLFFYSFYIGTGAGYLTVGGFLFATSTLALMLAAPMLAGSISLLFNIEGFKKYLVLFVLNLLGMGVALILLWGSESWGVILYFPIAFAIFAIFLIVQLFSNKILFWALALLLVALTITLFTKFQYINEIKTQKVTIPDIYSELRTKNNINEMVSYCNAIQLPSPRSDCAHKVYDDLFLSREYQSAITSENLRILCNNITRKDVNMAMCSIK